LIPLLPAADLSSTWQRSFFFDKPKADFAIADFACPSRSMCLAVGRIEQLAQLPYPYGVITRDGGDHWTPCRPPDFPISLFFLNDQMGWMVTERGIWQTRDAAAHWKKVKSGLGFLAVFFTGPEHGWLVGQRRQFEETSDGGAHWTAVPRVADDLARPPANIVFEYVHFSDSLHGVVVGEVSWTPDSFPPAWVDPQTAQFRPPPDGGVSGCQTADGGRTWACGSVGLHQSLMAVAFPDADRGWLVFAPAKPTDVYTEVTERNWSAWKSIRLYHVDGARISDLSTGPGGRPVVAAVQVSGKLLDTPMPGRVRIFIGNDFSTLHEETVDYRAVARRITLASAGSEWFAATDTGMILRRTR
jgi:photosystem II stability/assembly factor-like uncharacterized protein